MLQKLPPLSSTEKVQGIITLFHCKWQSHVAPINIIVLRKAFLRLSTLPIIRIEENYHLTYDLRAAKRQYITWTTWQERGLQWPITVTDNCTYISVNKLPQLCVTSPTRTDLSL
jgi:hypothetical protein